MIQACVFDLGGVIFDFDYGRFYKSVLPHCPQGISEADLARLAEGRHEQLGRGRISFEEYFAQFSEAAGLQIELEDFAQAWNDIFKEKAETIELIRRLQGVRKYLLSNTDESHIGWMRRRFPGVLEMFDECFYSFELGEAKPAPEIFRKVEAATGLAPNEHLLIDDIETNIAAAKKAGWEGVVFESVEGLIDKLKRLGAI